MPRKSKKIALFGGSFNPPHCAHSQVLDYLVATKEFDEVWILPNYAHAFGKKTIEYKHRRKMCEYISDHPQVLVCGVEGTMKKTPTYAIDVIRELKKKHPQYQFYFVVGSDVQNELNRWKDVEELKKKAEFYFLPRAGFENSPFMNVSSSEVREKIKNNKDVSHLLLEPIFEYIKVHQLYR